MFSMTFNHTPLQVTPLADLPAIGNDWPADDWKYADVQFVYSRTTDLVRKVIDATPLKGGFKRVLIDVKVQDLTPEITSCIPGWHIDGAFPEDGVVPDHHHLFVTNGPPTEFIGEPFTLSSTDPIKDHFRTLVGMAPKQLKVIACTPNAINTFTSYDLHRGVVAARPTRRLLIRLTETNTILAHNSPRRPSQGARTAAQ